MTEQQVAARLVYEMLRRGARKVSFDPIVRREPTAPCHTRCRERP